MPDVIEAIHQVLAADAGVAALCGANIFDIELDIAADATMAMKAIVVKPHGGPSGPSNLYINESRILLQCYGETPHLAYVVYWAAYLALKGMPPSVLAHTYLHNVIPGAGPIPGRDPTLLWPYNNSMFVVKASDMAV